MEAAKKFFLQLPLYDLGNISQIVGLAYCIKKTLSPNNTKDNNKNITEENNQGASIEIVYLLLNEDILKMAGI